MAEEKQNLALAPAERKGLVTSDASAFSVLLDTGRFEQLQRVAKLFSESTIIPVHYQKNPSNCFIALQMATRLGVDPMMFMQNTYIVHGKPGMMAQLAIALINSSGLFLDSLDFEIQGDDPNKDAYRVRAFAAKRSSGTMIYGPWVDWKIVKGEGWLAKDGSKWKTMPGLMFMYRSATFFARINCPECLMGMQTVEELEDTNPAVVENPQPRTESLAEKLLSQRQRAALDFQQNVIDQPPTAPVVAEAVAAGSNGPSSPAPPPAAPIQDEKIGVEDKTLRERISAWLGEMYAGDLDAMKAALATLSEFTTEEGEIRCSQSIRTLEGKWLRATYGRTKEAYGKFVEKSSDTPLLT